MRLAQAQYRELEAFAQFASDLDETTRKQLERGQRGTEILKQPQYAPLSIAEMAFSLFAADKGLLDDVEVKQVVAFERAMHEYIRSKYTDFLDEVNKNPVIDDEIANKMEKIINEFKTNGTW